VAARGQLVGATTCLCDALIRQAAYRLLGVTAGQLLFGVDLAQHLSGGDVIGDALRSLNPSILSNTLTRRV
jgi:hypothetical protein